MRKQQNKATNKIQNHDRYDISVGKVTIELGERNSIPGTQIFRFPYSVGGGGEEGQYINPSNEYHELIYPRAGRPKPQADHSPPPSSKITHPECLHHFAGLQTLHLSKMKKEEIARHGTHHCNNTISVNEGECDGQEMTRARRKEQTILYYRLALKLRSVYTQSQHR
jgi:hypothetical protein